MKKYSQFLKELPSNTVVFAFGRFNPPTTGHELLVKSVKKLAAQNKAAHAIYASKSQDAKKNPLTVDKKVHYLKLMFPGTNFVAANPTERTFMEAAKALNKKYKNIIMVAGSDRIAEYERILNTYNGKEFNFDTVQVISAGDRDPDADDAAGMSASKMRAVASKGDYSQFKKGLPSTMRDIDGRRLMNDVRHGMGLDSIKEHLNLVKDDLREQYFRGEIFNIGDIVEASGIQYEIVKRGSNHLLLKEESGKLISKWIQDIALVPQETLTEESMIPEALTNKTLKSQDKIKVARIIATMLGIENAETSSNPEVLINSALRKIRTKALNPEYLKTLDKMLNLATEVNIKYDITLKPSKLKESERIDTSSNYNIAKDKLRYKDYVKLSKMNEGDICPTCQKSLSKCKCESKDVVRDDSYQVGANNSRGFDPFFEEDQSKIVGAVVDMSQYEDNYNENMGDEEISDEELDAMADEIQDMEHVMDVYEDDEFAIVDNDTGEELQADEKENGVNEQTLMEVLSRIERMKAKMRIRRTKVKRERATKIALKRYSGTATINKRARRLAVKLMKNRLLRGRDATKISVGEKERVERVIERRKKIIGRLAMRLAPRVRKIEKARMSHTKFTAPAPAVSM